MEIIKNLEDSKLVIALEGRLDTETAPEFDEAVRSSVEGVTDLTLDLKELEYMSSAGLRVILAAQKIMDKQGKMSVRNCEKFRELFEMTGFINFLTIK